MEQIARTLAELHDDHGIAHRDVKPGNLYRYGHDWVVGDFGLVAVPDAVSLTGDNRPLGPTSFMPYEMLTDPAHADGGPADVYSFGKTLWVLATGQRWAPLGEQRADDAAYAMGLYRSHHASCLLDDLIARCTRSRPPARPPMRQVAADLRAWLARSANPEPVDVSDLAARLRTVAAGGIDDVARRRHLEELAGEYADSLGKLLRPLERGLEAEYPLTKADTTSQLSEGVLRYRATFGTPSLVAEEIRATVLDGPGSFPTSLVIGRSVAVTDDGLLRLGALCYMGRTGVMGGDFVWRPTLTPVLADTIEAVAAIEALAQEIQDNLRAWLDAFATRLEAGQPFGSEPSAPPRPSD